MRHRLTRTPIGPLYRSLGLVAGLALGGCHGNTNNYPDGGTPDAAAPDLSAGQPDLSGPVKVLKGPSKSSTIAISDDDSVVVMANQDDGSISAFSTTDNTRIVKLATGKEPSSVVIGPDGTTAFVANRADATVVKVTGVNTAGAQIAGMAKVGSEPTGLALSPTGAKLFVAEFAESRISVIDTNTMTSIGTITGLRNPRALAVTNGGTGNDSVETLVVPEFFGEPIAGKEAMDDGRQGRVRLYSVGDYSAQGSLTFAPLTATDAGFTVGTSPNQLWSVALSGSKIFVTSVSASPQPPPMFNQNVNPVLYVGDLTNKTEVRTATAGTINLARHVRDDITTGPKLFLADMADIAFLPSSNVAYIAARGADVVQRVQFDANATITQFGSSQNKQIDVNVTGVGAGPCLNPTGIVIGDKLTRAYVNCWVSRRLGVIDLTGQTLMTTVQSSDPPTTDADKQAQNGKRFYFTGRGRWSGDGTAAAAPTAFGNSWSSCGTCHPDGLTDNITWIFASGPRQTVSMDGTFSGMTLGKGQGTVKQRALNWTAIFDEIHDFEGNTRGVSGGMGAVTTAAAQANCGTLSMETRVGTDANATLPAGLGNPAVRELQNGTAGLPAGVRCTTNWDDVEAFVKTIRPPRGMQSLDQTSVQRGATIFGNAGGCVKCHGGGGFTVSRLFYAPATGARVTTLATMTAFAKPAAWPTSYTFQNTFQIAAQPIAAEVAGFNAAPIGPPQLACVVRNVGTFGIRDVQGNLVTADTNALEIKPGAGPPRSQGAGGFNVPSLYGLSVGAPYLHHGQAATLQALFSDTRFQAHWTAGAANFLQGGTAAQDRQDLINFLLSIDGSTTEQAVPAGFDGCPAN